MRSSSRPLSGAGSAAFCRFWGRRSWPSTARPAAARGESTPPRCTWFRRLRQGRDWCWGNGPRRRSPTRSRPFPNCSRRWRWPVVPSPSTPWAHKPPSPRPFRSAAPTTYWRSRTTSPNWPRRSRTFGAAFAPTPQPTPRTALPKPWTKTMAAWRRAAATCSINWNASINPGSGKGCAASPCWNRNAASATKPPANSASTSAAWLPTHPASPAPSAPTGPSRTACTGPWMSASTTTRCAPAPRPRPIIWRCSNTLPSTLSGSIRSNGKAASKPADSSPLPQTYTALNCSDSYDVHAIALRNPAMPIPCDGRFVRLMVRMAQRLSFLAACIVLGIILTGCGTPGAPQLPSLQLARPVDDLTASRKGNKVQLDWTLPRKNTDRTLVKNIPETRICRHEGSALMSGCTEVATVQNSNPGQKHEGEEPPAVRMKYVDILPAELGEQDPAGFVRYAVEILNTRNRSAGLSNQVLIPVAPTIAPPEQLTANVEADGVLISWAGADVPDAPLGLTFRYRITRSPAGANAFIALADVEPASEGFYLDKTFAWETKYDYRITSVTLVHSQGVNMAVEGADSKSAQTFTRDIYPPAEPSGLQAVFSSVGQKPFVDLTWAPNMESDLAGYNVFRGADGGEPQKLNQQLVRVPSFRDESVTPGKTYSYSVSAVDLRGNESPRSAETTEAVPSKQ